MVKWIVLTLKIVYLLVNTNGVECSMGEFLPEHISCYHPCADDCAKSGDFFRLSIFLKVFGWTCQRNCKYVCMWKTINIIEESQYLRTTMGVPKFYGKWPFVRLLGIQEPVSAIASLLNFLINLYMLRKLVRNQYAQTPFRYVWFAYGLVSLNAWFWSTIFHTYDVYFTEKMDYFCSFALIMYQFDSFFVRYLLETGRRRLLGSIVAMSLVFFMFHIAYLTRVEVNYDYNMAVNFMLGFSNCICWLVWCFKKYYFDHQTYVWQCAVSIGLLGLSFLLEVYDFKPLYWVLDAHGLWHLFTVVIPVFWYNFLIDDSYYSEFKRIQT